MAHRDFLAAAVSASAPGASAHAISAPPSGVFCVVEAPADFVLDDETAIRIRDNFEAITGVKCLVVSHGLKVHALPQGGVMQSESLGDYSYTVVAKDELTLQARLMSLCHGVKKV